MKAFILAGGFATRLWPLTEHRAKPMLLVDGKPILAHILEKIPKEVEIYVLTNSRFAADFKIYLQSVDASVHIFCEDAHTENEKLGALAAIAMAVKHFEIEDDLLLLAGDNLLPSLDFNQLIPKKNEARLATYALDDIEAARSFGVVELGKHLAGNQYQVVGFEEKPTKPKSKFVSTGFMSLSQNLLPTLVDFSVKEPDALGAVVPEFLKQGASVITDVVEGDWFDVGSYEAYLSAHKTLQKDPIIIEPGAVLENCQCEGKVYIGAGAQVKDCVLIDTIIYAKNRLEDCHISQSVIDENCQLKGVDLSRKLVRQTTTLQAD